MKILQFPLRAIKRFTVQLTVLSCIALVRFTKYVYVGELISLIPFHFGERVRYEFYRRTLAACGENVTINFGTVLSYPDITMGNNVWLGAYNIVGHADIGDNTLTAQGCHFVSGDHPFDRVDIPIMQQQGSVGRIRVGPDIWLGVGVIVMADIEQGSVVGAGSVVTRPIPPMSVAVGCPARVIRTRGQGSHSLGEADPLERATGERIPLGDAVET